MAARTSSSTHSGRTWMVSPSGRSRSENAKQGNRASARGGNEPGTRGPAEKKHKNMAEVRATGRQSDQGGSPGRRKASR
jgi:hypothetical protein